MDADTTTFLQIQKKRPEISQIFFTGAIVPCIGCKRTTRLWIGRSMIDTIPVCRTCAIEKDLSELSKRFWTGDA